MTQPTPHIIPTIEEKIGIPANHGLTQTPTIVIPPTSPPTPTNITQEPNIKPDIKTNPPKS